MTAGASDCDNAEGGERGDMRLYILMGRTTGRYYFSRASEILSRDSICGIQTCDLVQCSDWTAKRKSLKSLVSS